MTRRHDDKDDSGYQQRGKHHYDQINITVETGSELHIHVHSGEAGIGAINVSGTTIVSIGGGEWPVTADPDPQT